MKTWDESADGRVYGRWKDKCFENILTRGLKQNNENSHGIEMKIRREG